MQPKFRKLFLLVARLLILTTQGAWGLPEIFGGKMGPKGQKGSFSDFIGN